MVGKQTPEEDTAWDTMFSAQYEACEQIDKILEQQLKHLPVAQRVVAYSYVIEHLAEASRYEVNLTALKGST